MAKLRVRYEKEYYDEPANVIPIGSERQEHMVTVYVDGSDTVNHYRIVCDNPDLTIRRVRNEVQLIFGANTGFQEKVCTVSFYHNMDASAVVGLTFVQGIQEFGIDITENGEEVSEIQFHTLFDNNDVDSETRILDVECTGGVCDYNVQNVFEYAKSIGDSGYRAVSYDKGLVVAKRPGGILEITNHGKVSMMDNVFYEVVLVHRNSYSTRKSVKVTYSDEETNELIIG